MATAKKTTKKKSVIERIQSYEDACNELDMTPLTLDDFSKTLSPEKRQYLLSVERVTTVVEAMNEGHVFDYDNEDENKYFPWWDMETYDAEADAGSGFSLVDVFFVHTITFVGARLSMRERAHVEHVVKIMFEDYRIIMKK